MGAGTQLLPGGQRNAVGSEDVFFKGLGEITAIIGSVKGVDRNKTHNGGLQELKFTYQDRPSFALV